MNLRKIQNPSMSILAVKFLPWLGASLNHNTINFNIATELGSQLKKGSTCQGFTNDMRVIIPETSDYLYPDVVVACDDVKLDDHDSLLNPILIIEILSESTEKI